MGFDSSTDERALLFVFRLVDAEDVLSVKLSVGLADFKSRGVLR